MWEYSATGERGTAPEVQRSLDELAREGARRMIAEALEVEVEQNVSRLRRERDSDGHARADIKQFAHEVDARFPKAMTCLLDGQERMMTLYELPSGALEPSADHHPNCIGIRDRQGAGTQNPRRSAT